MTNNKSKERGEPDDSPPTSDDDLKKEELGMPKGRGKGRRGRKGGKASESVSKRSKSLPKTGKRGRGRKRVTQIDSSEKVENYSEKDVSPSQSDDVELDKKSSSDTKVVKSSKEKRSEKNDRPTSKEDGSCYLKREKSKNEIGSLYLPTSSRESMVLFDLGQGYTGPGSSISSSKTRVGRINSDILPSSGSLSSENYNTMMKNLDYIHPSIKDSGFPVRLDVSSGTSLFDRASLGSIKNSPIKDGPSISSVSKAIDSLLTHSNRSASSKVRNESDKFLVRLVINKDDTIKASFDHNLHVKSSGRN